MDNLRGLLGIRKMDRVPNVQIRQLCRVKSLDERIDEGILHGLAIWRGWRGIRLPRGCM